MKSEFKKLLIANRGEIAIRIARTAKDMGLEVHGIYSLDDKNSLHAHAIEFCHTLSAGGSRAYLDGKAIIELAKAKGIEAIHPGYGFLSENAEFARLCEESGIVFIGASSILLEASGNKVKARQLAEQCGIPVLKGLSRPCSLEEIQHFSKKEIPGKPFLIKAIAGGGGRGIGIVLDANKGLVNTYQSCKNEAKSAFGNEDVYVEQFLPNARHIEVQIM